MLNVCMIPVYKSDSPNEGQKSSPVPDAGRSRGFVAAELDTLASTNTLSAGLSIGSGTVRSNGFAESSATLFGCAKGASENTMCGDFAGPAFCQSRMATGAV